jgi:hypothetical protein
MSQLIWQDFAYLADEKYKEGRYILERELVTERFEVKRHLGKTTIEQMVIRPKPDAETS